MLRTQKTIVSRLQLAGLRSLSRVCPRFFRTATVSGRGNNWQCPIFTLTFERIDEQAAVIAVLAAIIEIKSRVREYFCLKNRERESEYNDNNNGKKKWNLNCIEQYRMVNEMEMVGASTLKLFAS